MTDPETVDTYQSVAARYRERHADRSGVAGLVERFLPLVEAAVDGTDGRVLDVGCGPGWEAATFADAGHEVVAVDLTPAFLAAAREEAPAAALARMDMRRLALAAGSFDGVWCCAALLHVPRAEAGRTLAGFRRVLRPGGALHVSVKCGTGTERGDAYPQDRRTFTLYRPAELRRLAADAGFAVESLRVDGGWVQLFGRAVPESGDPTG